MNLRALLPALAVLLLLVSRSPAAIPASVTAEADAAGCHAGLAVVVGSTDGVAEVALATGGTRLVQGLAVDDAKLVAARSAITAKNLTGLASAVRPTSLAPLPYADGLVDLLVIDVDALGANAPTEGDVSRVLAPGGVALRWAGGKWSRTVNPRPKDLDDWTHFDHDAAGTGQSADKRVAPPANVQWRLEVQPYRGWGGNPAGYRPYSAFRVAAGRSFCIENQADAEAAVAKDKAKAENLFLQARDAANGLPLWKVKLPGRAAGATHIEYHLVADAERVVWIPETGGAPVALDAATGKELCTYDVPPADLPVGMKSLPAAYYQLRLDQGALVASSGGAVHACDPATGKRRWSYRPADGLWAAFPRVLSGGRVLVQLVKPNDGYKVEMRWPNMPTPAVACVGLADGKEQWRVALPTLEEFPERKMDPNEKRKDKKPAPAGPMRIGQTMLAGDDLFLFGSSGIGASDTWGQVACVDVANKKLKWVNWTGNWGYNLVLRDGKPYWFTPSTLYAVSPEDGSVSKFFDAPFNNRCNRSGATGDWLVNGMGIWVDKEGGAVVRSIARSGCAQGPTLGQGMVMYTPNTCWCITQLRGHIALSAEPVKPPPADESRLKNDGGALVTGDAAAALKPTPFDGPISSEWPLQIYVGKRETDPVAGTDGRSYVAGIHEHRLDCRRDGRTVWSFSAGGRISAAPAVIGDAVLFGSHDGYAYCLDAGTGALRWRFYAGGAERQIVSHGQVESSWPVYNVVAHEGLGCFTAGLHPETGGGIFAWGLDPKTGAIKWKHKIARTEVKLASTKGQIAPNRVMNRPLAVEPDGTMSIIGLAFSPGEDPAAIQKRIDTMSLKDAARNWGEWTLRGEKPTKQ
ncbi:MAG TPA: PQQ-binding-like beta-propeller repeat protein [Humisphaera sp.]